MADFPQGADLASHRLIPGGAVEELERSLLTLDVIAHAIDLREAALPEYLKNLEAALEDVADSVVSRPGLDRDQGLGRVRFRERSAVARGRCGARCPGKVDALGRCEPAGAVRVPGPGGVRRHVPDSPDGV